MSQDENIPVSLAELTALMRPVQEKSNIMPIITISLGAVFALVSIIFNVVVVGGIGELKDDFKNMGDKVGVNAVGILNNANTSEHNREAFADIQRELNAINGQLAVASRERFYKSDGDKLDARLSGVEKELRERKFGFEKIEQQLKEARK